MAARARTQIDAARARDRIANEESERLARQLEAEQNDERAAQEARDDELARRLAAGEETFSSDFESPVERQVRQKEN